MNEMNEMIEMKWFLLLAIQYAISFCILGYMYGKISKEEES